MPHCCIIAYLRCDWDSYWSPSRAITLRYAKWKFWPCAQQVKKVVGHTRERDSRRARFPRILHGCVPLLYFLLLYDYPHFQRNGQLWFLKCQNLWHIIDSSFFHAAILLKMRMCKYGDASLHANYRGTASPTTTMQQCATHKLAMTL